MQTLTFPKNYFYSTEAGEILNEAAQAAMDYSSKVAARQVEFSRKMVEHGQRFSAQAVSSNALFNGGNSGEWENSVKDCYADFSELASDALSDLVKASDKGCDLWEQAAVHLVEKGSATLPKESVAFAPQAIQGIKVATTLAKESVNSSGKIAQTSLKKKESAENVARSNKKR